MKLLAIDTSSLACTVGVMNDDAIVERHEVKAREHTRLLMPMISSALDEAGLDLGDLDAIALGNGPGSFIGMRIGASVVQGLAFGAGLNIVPVSSMAVVAAEAGGPGDTVVVAQDAHMHQVYLGIYRIDEAGLPVALGDERLSDIESIADLDGLSVIAAGAGFERYPDLKALNNEHLSSEPDVLYPRAGFLLRLAADSLNRGNSIGAEALRPAYLRQEVAKKPGK